MMHGDPLSATLPEDSGLGERFWYWHGASGRRYIHSIYKPELCPPVPVAVFVLVRRWGGGRRAVAAGRFDESGALPLWVSANMAGSGAEEELHVHLLARDTGAAEQVLRDLLAAMEAPVRPPAESRPYTKPVQLDLLAA